MTTFEGGAMNDPVRAPDFPDKPSDIVPAVIFLACVDSPHITGAFLLIDGG